MASPELASLVAALRATPREMLVDHSLLTAPKRSDA